MMKNKIILFILFILSDFLSCTKILRFKKVSLKPNTYIPPVSSVCTAQPLTASGS